MKSKTKGRAKRKRSIRKKINGTAERPRLAVFRSTSHIYAQVINDGENKVLVAASSLSPALRKELDGLKKREQATKVGLHIASLCKDKGVAAVSFDRGGFRFHGRVKALAEGARKAGLHF